jgi:Zn-dependent M16 (insulinase) family peptidase
MKTGETYHGFRLTDIRKIEEIHAKGLTFLHEKSGARLIYLQNDDDNKVFSITFRTPPRDSTGIPHILEHSVLCGSRKFPSKEPFIELAKGSLNTFLNAMTFPDKTMYPVASRNARDFLNLMDVYLDAVFHPKIYQYPEIFMQEGWHHELESRDSALDYRGVVYNEMKGVFSSPESVLFRKIPESLFPETAYGFESGGDPDAIPELSYDQFIAFHKRYYHPSNSYIVFYGDGDVQDHLRLLHEGYLRDFERIAVDSEITLQTAFQDPRELDASYALLPTENEMDKTFLSLNFATDRATNPEVTLALTILEYLLLETPAAPLKKALQDAGIGKDVFGSFEKDILQPIFSIVVKNSNPDKREQFKKVVFDTLADLVKGGIDKKQIEAAINIHEFRLREADFKGLPKGIVYCITVMGSWLYGADPFMHLQYEPTLRSVKRALRKPHFEQLIQKYLLHNKHQSLVMVVPEKGLMERKAAQLQKGLENYKNKLSDDERDGLVAQSADLKRRQTTPDSPADLKKIPLLTLEDIDPQSEHLPLEEREFDGVRVLSHPVFTSGIAYVNLFFDTRVLPLDDVPYVSLLSAILGKVSTEHYSYAELSNQILINTGGISFAPETFGQKDDDSIYYPKLMVKSKALVQKLPELGDLVGEILNASRFDDAKRLREIVQESRSRFEMGIYDRGHFIAAGRLLSYFSPRARYAEMLGGIAYFKFLTHIEKNFDSLADEVSEKLKQVAQTVFNRNNLSVSVTTEEKHYDAFGDSFPRILDVLQDAQVESQHYSLDYGAKNEGLLTPGKVQYVAKGCNFRKLGFQYTGGLQVLRTVASLDYLWNRIRVQGGAYGSFARFERDGNMYFCSYRDPHLAETIGVYNGAADYFRSFDADVREIRKYIIGTVSRIDHPLTPSMKGELAAERYFCGVSHEDVQKNRDEILSTTVGNIRECADLIAESMHENYLCVLGNESIIRESSDLFDGLVQVFD